MVHHGNETTGLSATEQRIASVARGLRAVDRAWSDALRTRDALGVGQAAILRALAAGSSSLLELVRVDGRDRSTISVAVSSLVERGLVERSGDPRDRRRSRLLLTPAGAEALERVDARAERVAELVSDALGEDGVAELDVLLDRLSAGLARADEQASSRAGRRC